MSYSSCVRFVSYVVVFCFFKQKTAYEMRSSDWSSDVCSSDLTAVLFNLLEGPIFLFAGKGCRTVHVDVVDRIPDHAFEAISDDALKLDTVASQLLFGLLEPVVGLRLLEIVMMSIYIDKDDHSVFILPSAIERVGAHNPFRRIHP